MGGAILSQKGNYMTESSPKGFAAMSPEKAKAIRRKSLETRARKKQLKLENEAQAKKLREEALELRKKAEMLLEEADGLDGQCSSEKLSKKRDLERSAELDKLYAGTVAGPWLTLLKQYANSRDLSADEVMTPSFVALDILHDSRSTIKEKENAMKMLQQYENAKPTAQEEPEHQVGSMEKELQELKRKLTDSAPKARKQGGGA